MPNYWYKQSGFAVYFIGLTSIFKLTSFYTPFNHFFMKNIICLITLVLGAYCRLTAQNVADLELFEAAIKPNAILTYDVTVGGKKHQLIVTLGRVGDDITFEYKTTEAAAKEGLFWVSANAVSKADALFTVFNGGKVQVDKETALFISRKMFNDVATTSAASIKMGGTADTATVMSNTISEFNFSVNGNLVAIPGWELEGGSDIKYTLDVIESAKFPLIYKLDMGWTMQLVEVKNP